MPFKDSKRELERGRSEFRAWIAQAGAARIWNSFGGRIAAVLSGGGSRGAYEAGVLLAFQDAGLPTHIITATSIGSINAASFASHSNSVIGNAESLVETWSGITPTAVGIEWTRYLWVLGGLIAASAGFGNLLRYEIISRGFEIHLQDPALTWFALGLAGTAVLLLYDRLSYLGYVAGSLFHRTLWKPNLRKTLLSLLANVIVWGFLAVVVRSLHMRSRVKEILRDHPWAAVVVLAAIAVLVAARRPLKAGLSLLLHWLLRLPLRPGLFTNFERGRLLRERISSPRLLASPIRLVFTATDLRSGEARFFSNTPREDLAKDPGADPRFVEEEVVLADDPLGAVIASSALPIAYEPIQLSGRLYTDGGIVANQPIRPAIRLGADVLFLVMMDPPSRSRSKAHTFVDVGLRALDILMLQNLLTDLKILTNVNLACEHAAAELGVRPEELEIDLGTRRYRYVKAFTVRPAESLGGTVLDFSGRTTAPAILRGYRDACAQIETFLAYAPKARFGQPRRVLRFAREVRQALDASPSG